MNINRLIAQTESRRSRPDLWSRRDFLKTASTATLAALAAGAPRSLLAGEKMEKIKPTADLTRRQARKMATHPDMIVQYAQELARQFADEGYPAVEVRAAVSASLNGRPKQRLIDPDVDLTKVRLFDLRPKPWIVPLTEPLPERRTT